MALNHRTAPLRALLSGKAPLCPWRSALLNLHPATWGTRPPAMDITVVGKQEKRHLLRFGGKHEFWFPESMSPSLDLWSEYLVTTWDHRSNPHFYLTNGVCIRHSDLVVDCGACEGFFARQALDAGAAKVLCVEPNPEMAACLEATFPVEISEGRLEVLPVALGSFAGEARFHVEDGEAFSGTFSGLGENSVTVTTLDELATTHGCPSMIKMDLEGGEYEALRGGANTLRDHHPTLAVTTYHQPWDYAVVSSLLAGLGYSDIRMTSSSLRSSGIPRPVMLHAVHNI